MPFPQSPLGIDLFFRPSGTNGASDVSLIRDDSKPYRLLNDNNQGINITRGRANEQGRTAASVMTFTLFDPNGYFNNDNPRSPYYGILPRNTLLYCYTKRPTASLNTRIPNYSGSAFTTHKAALNPSGNLDVRIEWEPQYARRQADGGYSLVGKWSTGAEKISWAIDISSRGLVRYLFSTDGTTGTLRTFQTASPLPNTTGRIALRVFHTLDNGAGSTNVLFQTAPTINGTYTTLDNRTSGAVVTAIFGSTANLTINADHNNFAFEAGGYRPHTGRVYAMQLRNGAGTVVASPDFSAQTPGISSFADAQANTWALNTSSGAVQATIDERDYRFAGELTSVTQVAEKSSKATVSQFTVSGVINRLTANQTPLFSPIRKNFQNYSPQGYWPCEDGSQTQAASSAAVNCPPATISDITFSSDNTLPGTAGVAVLGGTGPYFDGKAAPATNGNITNFIAFFKFPSVPLSGLTLFSVYGTGTASRIDFGVTATTYTVTAYNNAGTVISSSTGSFTTLYTPTFWIGININQKVSGGTVTLKCDFFNAGTGLFGTMGGLATYSGIPGTFTRVVTQGLTALSGVRMAHLILTQFDVPFTQVSFANYALGYAGERAADRFTRLLNEANVFSQIIGNASDTEQMGPQTTDTLMNLLYQCQDVDGGEIFEPRETWGIYYRTRVSCQNQYGLDVSYTVSKQLADTLKPTPDLSGVSNDVTWSRTNGGSARAVLISGTMSTAEIGTVATQPQGNNYLDTRNPALAQYLLGLGTWPEARYPNVTLAMHRITAWSFYDTTFSRVARTDVSDLINVNDLPVFLPPGPLSFFVRGYTENFSQFLWTITYNTTPYGPYRTNELTGVTAEDKRVSDVAGSTVLASALTSTATSASVTTSPLMIQGSSAPAFPFDILIAGERCTVTAISGTSSPQTMTITRSVNGVVKAQAAGAQVRLWTPNIMYVSL